MSVGQGVGKDVPRQGTGPAPTDAWHRGLLGRDAELAVLRGLVDALPDGGRAVLVRGEPGVGKSTLLQAACDLAADAGALVLRAVGVESTTVLPFTGLGHLLTPLLPDTAGLPPVQERALLTALDLRAGPVPSLFLTALAALSLVTGAAEERPVALVVDDLQWVDAATGAVLAFLARRLHHDPVLLVAAARDGHAVPLDDADVQVLALGGLEEQASRRLVSAVAGGLPAATVRLVLAQALGNPLALVELPRTVLTADADGAPSTAPALALGERLERAFAARSQELPAATRDALLVAAVDAEAGLGEVLTAAGLLRGGPVGAAALEPAQRVGLLALDEVAVRFRHPLVRSAVLALEPRQRRQAAHAALGAVASLPPDRRLRHQAQAVDAPDDAVADRLDASHLDHLRRGAVSSAVSALESAAGLTSGSGRRGRRLLLAATLAVGLGDGERVRQLLRAAEAADLSRSDLARAGWLRSVFQDSLVGASEQVEGLCRSAQQCVADGEVDLALDLLLSLAVRLYWTVGDVPARSLLLRLADGLADRADDPRRTAVLALGDPRGRTAETQERLRRVPPGSVTDVEHLRQLGIAARAVGEEVLAADHFDAAAARLRESGQLGLLSQVLVVRVAVGLDLGEWRQCAQDLEEGRRLGEETGQPVWETGARTVAARLAALTGRPEEALQQVVEVERLCASRGVNDFLPLAQIARGVALLSTGRPADALAALEPVFDPRDPRHSPREQLSALGFLVDAALLCGAADTARAVVDAVEAGAAGSPSALLVVQLLHARAVLAPDAQAEGRFLAALGEDLHRWPWPRARLQLAYGSWLRRHRRLAECREPLRAALATFDDIGAVDGSRAARDGLRAAGERDARTPELAPEELLTAQEMHIARLAATGLSNREIGEQMYLSPRTIGAHLYRIFPRLAISSRTQLAGRLLPGA